MAQKKYTAKNNDAFIDGALLLKNWLYFKKLVIFGTLIVTLIAMFIIILFNNAPKQDNISKYISAIIQSDLLENNDRAIAGLKSPEILKKTLETLSFDLSIYDIAQSLVIQKATNPLAENLQELIVNLELNDIKKLALTKEALASVMQQLQNTSDDLISIQFHYESLNLTDLQAKNLIYLLVKNVNRNLLLNTNRQNLGLRFIDTGQYIMGGGSESENLSRLYNISNSIKDNLLKLNNEYSDLIIRFDLSRLDNMLENAQKLLYHISKLKGHTSTTDNIKLEISEIDRNLNDLSVTLSYIDNRSNQSTDLKNSLSNPDQNPSFQMDDQLFDKILSIGNVLNLSEFRQKTLIKQNELQQLKNNLLSKVAAHKLDYKYQNKDLSIEYVEKRISVVAEEVNLAISQVRSISNPKQAIEFVQNPEFVIIDISNKNIKNLIKIVITLSIISFICLSFIVFLLNPKSTRRT